MRFPRPDENTMSFATSDERELDLGEYKLTVHRNAGTRSYLVFRDERAGHGFSVHCGTADLYRLWEAIGALLVPPMVPGVLDIGVAGYRSEPIAEEDDGCPVNDPDCLGNNGDCHDACEAPTAESWRDKAPLL